jgi:hypothetical protein
VSFSFSVRVQVCSLRLGIFASLRFDGARL